MKTIHVQMMDHFAICVDGVKCEQPINKSRKGLALMQYLILKRGASVPNYRLLAAFWPDDESVNPESALKTLVSRVRAQLNQILPDLGRCIVADRGAYHWQCMDGMTVDVYEVEDILEAIAQAKNPGDVKPELYERLIALYKGDLLQHSDNHDWVVGHAAQLHSRYMEAMYGWLDVLKQDENYEKIVNVCHDALEVDNFDDHLHMELMSALIKTGRTSDALVQYKHVIHLHYRYLGIQPSENLQEFYKQIVNAGKTLEFNLESIRSELQEGSDRHGAFVCEYTVFKELYNLQVRNLELMGSTMFLAVIMISDLKGNPLEPQLQNSIMTELMEILRSNLRSGDAITRFSPTILALLLPAVDYNTCNMMMENIMRLFYLKRPNSSVSFNYRIGPLGNDDNFSGSGIDYLKSMEKFN